MKEIRQTCCDHEGDYGNTRREFRLLFVEYLESLDLCPILEGASDSSTYYRIEAGIVIDPEDGYEDPISYIVRLSDHRRFKNYGVVDFEVDYEWDGDDLVIRELDIVRFEKWITEKKQIVIKEEV